MHCFVQMTEPRCTLLVRFGVLQTQILQPVSTATGR